MVVVAALGTTQTLAWASSYYLPAILADDIAADIGVSRAWVFGAFSASLLLSAFLGPAAACREHISKQDHFLAGLPGGAAEPRVVRTSPTSRSHAASCIWWRSWTGRSTATPRKRYGNILCPGAGLVVRGFGPSAAMPILRISRCTRLRLTACPSARSSAVSRREPRNGHVVNSSSIRRISGRSLSFAARGGRYTPERAIPSSSHWRRIDSARCCRSTSLRRS